MTAPRKATKSELRRESLRAALIDAAEQQIRAQGVASVKARDLAQEVGCATGAIYNVFDDLNALIMAVNGRTFLALGAEVAMARKTAAGAAPRDVLIAMSHAYLDYAAQETNLWHALFDIQLQVGDAPEWYLSEMNKLYAHISDTLLVLWPTRDGAEIDLLTRALFSSVHGIVLLGLENRVSAVPRDEIADMIAKTLTLLTD